MWGFDGLGVGLLAALADVREVEDDLLAGLVLGGWGLFVLWFIIDVLGLVAVGLLLLVLLLLLFGLFAFFNLGLLFLLIIVHGEHLIILNTVFEELNGILGLKLNPVLMILGLEKPQNIVPQTLPQSGIHLLILFILFKTKHVVNKLYRQLYFGFGLQLGEWELLVKVLGVAFVEEVRVVLEELVELVEVFSGIGLWRGHFWVIGFGIRRFYGKRGR